MRATPLPKSWQGKTVIIGPSDPTDPHLRAAEYAVTPSQTYPGRPEFTVRIVLDKDDRLILVDGGVLWLSLDGAEVPWIVQATAEDSEVPM